jgi:hypothetical protein
MGAAEKANWWPSMMAETRTTDERRWKAKPIQKGQKTTREDAKSVPGGVLGCVEDNRRVPVSFVVI